MGVSSSRSGSHAGSDGQGLLHSSPTNPLSPASPLFTNANFNTTNQNIIEQENTSSTTEHHQQHTLSGVGFHPRRASYHSSGGGGDRGRSAEQSSRREVQNVANYPNVNLNATRRQRQSVNDERGRGRGEGEGNFCSSLLSCFGVCGQTTTFGNSTVWCLCLGCGLCRRSDGLPPGLTGSPERDAVDPLNRELERAQTLLVEGLVLHRRGNLVQAINKLTQGLQCRRDAMARYQQIMADYDRLALFSTQQYPLMAHVQQTQQYQQRKLADKPSVGGLGSSTASSGGRGGPELGAGVGLLQQQHRVIRASMISGSSSSQNINTTYNNNNGGGGGSGVFLMNNKEEERMLAERRASLASSNPKPIVVVCITGEKQEEHSDDLPNITTSTTRGGGSGQQPETEKKDRPEHEAALATYKAKNVGGGDEGGIDTSAAVSANTTIGGDSGADAALALRNAMADLLVVVPAAPATTSATPASEGLPLSGVGGAPSHLAPPQPLKPQPSFSSVNNNNNLLTVPTPHYRRTSSNISIFSITSASQHNATNTMMMMAGNTRTRREDVEGGGEVGGGVPLLAPRPTAMGDTPQTAPMQIPPPLYKKGAEGLSCPAAHQNQIAARSTSPSAANSSSAAFSPPNARAGDIPASSYDRGAADNANSHVYSHIVVANTTALNINNNMLMMSNPNNYRGWHNQDDTSEVSIVLNNVTRLEYSDTSATFLLELGYMLLQCGKRDAAALFFTEVKDAAATVVDGWVARARLGRIAPGSHDDLLLKKTSLARYGEACLALALTYTCYHLRAKKRQMKRIRAEVRRKLAELQQEEDAMTAALLNPYASEGGEATGGPHTAAQEAHGRVVRFKADTDFTLGNPKRALILADLRTRAPANALKDRDGTRRFRLDAIGPAVRALLRGGGIGLAADGSPLLSSSSSPTSVVRSAFGVGNGGNSDNTSATEKRGRGEGNEDEAVSASFSLASLFRDQKEENEKGMPETMLSNQNLQPPKGKSSKDAPEEGGAPNPFSVVVGNKKKLRRSSGEAKEEVPEEEVVVNIVSQQWSTSSNNPPQREEEGEEEEEQMMMKEMKSPAEAGVRTKRSLGGGKSQQLRDTLTSIAQSGGGAQTGGAQTTSNTNISLSSNPLLRAVGKGRFAEITGRAPVLYSTLFDVPAALFGKRQRLEKEAKKQKDKLLAKISKREKRIAKRRLRAANNGVKLEMIDGETGEVIQDWNSALAAEKGILRRTVVSAASQRSLGKRSNQTPSVRGGGSVRTLGLSVGGSPNGGEEAPLDPVDGWDADGLGDGRVGADGYSGGGHYSRASSSNTAATYGKGGTLRKGSVYPSGSRSRGRAHHSARVQYFLQNRQFSRGSQQRTTPSNSRNVSRVASFATSRRSYDTNNNERIATNNSNNNNSSVFYSRASSSSVGNAFREPSDDEAGNGEDKNANKKVSARGEQTVEEAVALLRARQNTTAPPPLPSSSSSNANTNPAKEAATMSANTTTEKKQLRNLDNMLTSLSRNEELMLLSSSSSVHLQKGQRHHQEKSNADGSFREEVHREDAQQVRDLLKGLIKTIPHHTETDREQKEGQARIGGESTTTSGTFSPNNAPETATFFSNMAVQQKQLPVHVDDVERDEVVHTHPPTVEAASRQRRGVGGPIATLALDKSPATAPVRIIAVESDDDGDADNDDDDEPKRKDGTSSDKFQLISYSEKNKNMRQQHKNKNSNYDAPHPPSAAADHESPPIQRSNSLHMMQRSNRGGGKRQSVGSAFGGVAASSMAGGSMRHLGVTGLVSPAYSSLAYSSYGAGTSTAGGGADDVSTDENLSDEFDDFEDGDAADHPEPKQVVGTITLPPEEYAYTSSSTDDSESDLKDITDNNAFREDDDEGDSPFIRAKNVSIALCITGRTKKKVRATLSKVHASARGSLEAAHAVLGEAVSAVTVIENGRSPILIPLFQLQGQLFLLEDDNLSAVRCLQRCMGIIASYAEYRYGEGSDVELLIGSTRQLLKLAKSNLVAEMAANKAKQQKEGERALVETSQLVKGGRPFVPASKIIAGTYFNTTPVGGSELPSSDVKEHHGALATSMTHRHEHPTIAPASSATTPKTEEANTNFSSAPQLVNVFWAQAPAPSPSPIPPSSYAGGGAGASSSGLLPLPLPQQLGGSQSYLSRSSNNNLSQPIIGIESVAGAASDSNNVKALASIDNGGGRAAERLAGRSTAGGSDSRLSNTSRFSRSPNISALRINVIEELEAAERHHQHQLNALTAQHLQPQQAAAAASQNFFLFSGNNNNNYNTNNCLAAPPMEETSGGSPIEPLSAILSPLTPIPPSPNAASRKRLAVEIKGEKGGESDEGARVEFGRSAITTGNMLHGSYVTMASSGVSPLSPASPPNPFSRTTEPQQGHGQQQQHQQQRKGEGEGDHHEEENNRGQGRRSVDALDEGSRPLPEYELAVPQLTVTSASPEANRAVRSKLTGEAEMQMQQLQKQQQGKNQMISQQQQVNSAKHNHHQFLGIGGATDRLGATSPTPSSVSLYSHAGLAMTVSPNSADSILLGNENAEKHNDAENTEIRKVFSGVPTSGEEIPSLEGQRLGSACGPLSPQKEERDTASTDRKKNLKPDNDHNEVHFSRSNSRQLSFISQYHFSQEKATRERGGDDGEGEEKDFAGARSGSVLEGVSSLPGEQYESFSAEDSGKETTLRHPLIHVGHGSAGNNNKNRSKVNDDDDDDEEGNEGFSLKSSHERLLNARPRHVLISAAAPARDNSSVEGKEVVSSSENNNTKNSLLSSSSPSPTRNSSHRRLQAHLSIANLLKSDECHGGDKQKALENSETVSPKDDENTPQKGGDAVRGGRSEDNNNNTSSFDRGNKLLIGLPMGTIPPTTMAPMHLLSPSSQGKNNNYNNSNSNSSVNNTTGRNGMGIGGIGVPTASMVPSIIGGAGLGHGGTLLVSSAVRRPQSMSAANLATSRNSLSGNVSSSASASTSAGAEKSVPAPFGGARGSTSEASTAASNSSTNTVGINLNSLSLPPTALSAANLRTASRTSPLGQAPPQASNAGPSAFSNNNVKNLGAEGGTTSSLGSHLTAQQRSQSAAPSLLRRPTTTAESTTTTPTIINADNSSVSTTTSSKLFDMPSNPNAGSTNTNTERKISPFVPTGSGQAHGAGNNAGGVQRGEEEKSNKMNDCDDALDKTTTSSSALDATAYAIVDVGAITASVLEDHRRREGVE